MSNNSGAVFCRGTVFLHPVCMHCNLHSFEQHWQITSCRLHSDIVDAIKTHNLATLPLRAMTTCKLTVCVGRRYKRHLSKCFRRHILDISGWQRWHLLWPDTALPELQFLRKLSGFNDAIGQTRDFYNSYKRSYSKVMAVIQNMVWYAIRFPPIT